MRTYSGLDPETSYGGAKLTIYYFNDRNDLEAVAPDRGRFTVGLYSSCEDGVEAVAMHSDFAPKPNVITALQPEDQGMVAIQQAYARHFFYAHFPTTVPLWYIEGYAQYFSTIRFDGNKAIVGMPPMAEGVLLFGIDNASYKPALDYRGLLINDARTHTGDDPDFLKQVEDAGNADARAPAAFKDQHFMDKDAEDRARLEFESRAWLLTHWILSAPERTKKLPDYVAAIAGGDSGPTAFHKVFDQNPVQLEATLSHYLRKTLVVGTLDAPDVDAQPVFEDLPESSAWLLLLNARLGTCPSQADGQGVLNDIRTEAAKFPGDQFAGDVLSQAEITYGKPQAAIPYLNEAVSELPGDFGAQYLLGRAQLAAASSTSGDARAAALTAADAAFMAAAKLNPNSASNSYWYYRTKLAEGGSLSQDAAGAAVHAWHMAPEVDAYAFHAALVYAVSGDRATAASMLDGIARDPRGGDYPKLAATWRDKLKAGAADAEILAAMSGDMRHEGQAEWTLDDNSVLGNTVQITGRDDFVKMYQDSEKAAAIMQGRSTPTAPTQGQKPASED